MERADDGDESVEAYPGGRFETETCEVTEEEEGEFDVSWVFNERSPL